MKFISHRGNLGGPKPPLENSPSYIDEALRAGFDVEVDLRLVGEQFYLGHDYPQHKIDAPWLEERRNQLLVHVKDVRCLNKIVLLFSHWHFFCHTQDSFTFTSRKYVWLHDLSLPPTAITILPLISASLLDAYPNKEIYAICTDFVIR